MNKIFTCLLTLICSGAQAQPNSIALKDGAGLPISMHNTIADAYAAIPAVLANAYIIEINATYTGASEVYPIVFVSKTGSSTANTITLRPALGVTSIVVGGSKPAGNILTLDDADYVIIDGRPGGIGTTRALKFINTGTTGNSNNIQFINGATFNKIRYCNFSNSTTSGTGRDLSFSTSASNISGNSDNDISYCAFDGGRYMINSSGSAPNPNTRIRIFGCEISNFNFAGFWGQAGTGKVYIDSCKFFHNVSVNESLVYAILFDAQSDSAILTRNQIYDISQAGTGGVKGISVRSSTGTNYVQVANNFISLGGSTTTSINLGGIEITASSTTVSTNMGIYYNSVRLTGSLASGGSSGNVVSASLIRSGTTTGLAMIDIRNNIFVNERLGGASGVQHVAMALINNGGTLGLDHNTYNCSSGNLVRNGSTVYTDMSTYQASAGGNETNSNAVVVQFAGATDLHLAGTSIGNQNLKAQPIAGITTDIDNQVRGSVPYRGADEASVPLPVSLFSFSADTRQNDVWLNWATAFENNSSVFEIQRSTDQVNFQVIGSIAAAGSSAMLRNYGYPDRNILEKDLAWIYYRLRLVDRDGAYTFSKIIRVKNPKAGELVISVYPLPFNAYPTLSISSGKAGIAGYRLLNSSGQVILNGQMTLKAGLNRFDMHELAKVLPGTYFLEVEFGDLRKNQLLFKTQ